MSDDDFSLKIFKYTTLKTLNDYILPNQELTLRSVSDWNDPFEAEFTGFTDDDELTDLSGEELKIIQSDTHFKKITIDNRLRNHYRSICFGSVHNDMIMWSHYADEHRGVCLEFELRSLSDQGKFDGSDLFENFDQNNEIFLEVNYKSLVDDKFVENFDRKKNIHYPYQEVLATKGFQWSYEKEWRFISNHKEKYLQLSNQIIDAKKNNFDKEEIKKLELKRSLKLKKFNKSKLRAVYFGLNCEPPYKSFSILDEEYPDVKRFKMAKHQYRYQINADPISYNPQGFFYKPGGKHLPEKYS